MEIKFGEKYELKQDKEYFCIQLQRMVKFTSRVCVELESRSVINYYDPEKPNFVYFGKLIDLNQASGPDYVTENMIEFEKDDIVRIMDHEGKEIGVGRVSFDSQEARQLMGQHGQKALVHYNYLYLE